MGFAAIEFRFFVGLIFLLAGMAKLPQQSDFEQVVRAYTILPSRLVAPVARLIPLAEVAIGTLLLVGLEVRAVAGVAASALSIFSAAAVINLARGRDLDCGCYAVGAPRKVTWLLVARNGILIVAAAIVAAAAPPTLALDGIVSDASHVAVTEADAMALLLAATMAVLALTLIGELWRLHSVLRREVRA